MFKKFRPLLLFVLILLTSSCNLPSSTPTAIPAALPTAEPTAVSKTGDIKTYTDLSSIIFDVGGPVTLGDGSQQNTDPFWMYQSDVTNGQYTLCVAIGACTPPDPQDNPDFNKPANNGLPVDGVSFDQAQAYCAWMGGSLPTEEQFIKVDTDLKMGSNLLPPSPCAGDSKCSPQKGFASELVAGSQAGGNPGVIILQAGGIILQAGGFILQRGGIILQDRGGIILQNDAGGIILQNNNGSGGQAQPYMKVYDVTTNAHATGLNFRCVIPHPTILLPACTILRGNKDFPQAVCPAPGPSIAIVGTFCQNGQPYFTVDIKNAPAGYQVGVVNNYGTSNAEAVDQTQQDCTIDQAHSTSDSTRLVCKGTPNTSTSQETVWAMEQCAPPAGWSSSDPCLNGYQYDSSTNMCDYLSSSTAYSSTALNVCQTGFTASPAGCCAPAKNYPAVCPPGDIFEGTDVGCVSYSSIAHVVHQDVNLPDCSIGNGGRNKCSKTCSSGQVLDPKTCTCLDTKP